MIADTTGTIEYRDAWQKDDPDIRRDVIAFGARMGDPSSDVAPEDWARDLCVVAYEGNTVVGLAACTVRYGQRVRTNMAFLRIIIAPEYRRRGIAVPLTHKFYDIMRRYALANPNLKIGGIAAIVTVKGFMDEPITPAGLVLVGYTPKDEPVIVKWFDHFRL